MPRRSPFTALCVNLHAALHPVVADLHAHTTASDGDFTPSGLVALAKQARLTALAVTDHDTLAGYPEAHATGVTLGVRVVPGVECTAVWAGRELHVLGLFVDPADAEFLAHLAAVGRQRRARFLALVEALAGQGVAFTPGQVEGLADRVPSLGRRHVAGLLVNSGVAASWGEAFGLYLKAVLPAVPPTHFTELPEVARRIHAAGGVALLAHPPSSFEPAQFAELHAEGLDGLEVGHPSQLPGRVAELRAVAASLGMLVSAGSDFHATSPHRRVGSFGLTREPWAALTAGRAGRW